MDTNKKQGLMPKLAKRLGERSVNSACVWLWNQPKVPEAMSNVKKEKK